MRTKINWVTMAWVTLPMIGVGIFLILMGLRADPRLMTDDGLMSQRKFFILMGAFFIGLNTLISGGILLSALGRNRRLQRLEAAGLRGSATVLQVHETGTYINNQPQVWMELQVNLPNRDPYFVEKRMVVPYTRLGQVEVNSAINVLVDPQRVGSPKGVELIFK